MGSNGSGSISTTPLVRQGRLDAQPIAHHWTSGPGHDLARSVCPVAGAPTAGIGELHLVRVMTPMVSDDLPVSAGHCRHPARGIPSARFDMTALPMCGL